MVKKYKKTSLIDDLAKLPWWFNACIAFMVCMLPALLEHKIKTNNLWLIRQNYSLISYLCYFLAFIFALVASISYARRQKEKRILTNQKDISTLYMLSWDQLETLVKELFSKMGYHVKQRGGAKADGGVDLEAYRSRKKTIIQCKQWKSTKVGVSIVREMYGVMMHEKAQNVYIITCGSFTKEAKEFAKGKPIFLIHGFRLIEMIKALKS